jgi:N-acyl-D-amino-acid deacylase
MKRPIVRAGLVLLAAILLGVGASAQMYPGSYPYNPYTGGTVPQAPYNPLVSGGAPGAQPNPFTGGLSKGGPALNPYTNKPLTQPTAYNLFTGKHQTVQALFTPTAWQVYQWPKGEYPVTGKAGPGLEPLDEVVQMIMVRHGIPGASLAVAKDGKLIYAKGFGWANLATAFRCEPLTLFGLASLSKPLTALAILLLVDQGQLDLDDRPFDMLKHIQPPPGVKVDPNLKKITIRQLLNHSGGWDRNKSGDPVNWEPQIANALGITTRVSDEQFISFMMGMPLDFEPGSKNVYSNVGYIILGQVIEKVSGQPYQEFVRQKVLQPAGMQHVYLSEGSRPYKFDEAHHYLAGTSIQLPPMDFPMVVAAGGWNGTAVDMVRFLTALDGSRGKPLLKDATFKKMLASPLAPLKARPDGTYFGLGWPAMAAGADGFTYMHDGNFHGMRTFMKRSAKGLNWALLFNVSMQPDQIDAQIMSLGAQEVHEKMESIEKHPDVDLFPQFP